jgi:hypothetical protein
MGLVEELKARRADILKQTEDIDREAAKVREQFEERLADLRKQRIPLEERLRLIDALIQAEGGK